MQPLDAFFEHSAEAAAWVGSDGRIARANAALRGRLGDCVGRAVVELVVPDDRMRLHAALGDARRIEVRLSLPARPRVGLVLRPLEDGVWITFGKTRDDVEALLEVPEPILAVDQSFRLLRANSALRERAPAATVGESALELLPPDPETWKERFNAALAGVPVRAIDHVEIAPGLAISTEWTLNPLEDADGRTYAVGCFGRNITERARIMELLRESERDTAALVDNTPDLIWSADSTLALRMFNQAFREFVETAHGIEATPGLSVLELHPGGGEDEWLDRYEAALDGQRVVAVVPLQDGSGEAEVVLHPILDRERVTGVAGFSRDITERAEFERALTELNGELRVARDRAVQASRAKSTFLANMSHELRTPLNAIMGYSEMLAEDAEIDGLTEFVRDLMRIHSAGDHLLGLINDILDLSKIEAGKMDLVAEAFSLPDLLIDIESTVKPLIARKENTLRLEVDPRLGSIVNDEVRVRQILLNLLSNAAKFTDCGRIGLDAELATGDIVEFRVTDTGIGMTQAQMDRLFQDFEQGDASTTRRYGGTGLGLAISRRFAEMMGGSISVSSEVGEGATFTVRIPVVVEPKHAELVTTTSGGVTTIDSNRSVLCIDDDDTVLDLFRRMLEPEGIQVLTAKGGEEGLRLAREHRPAAVTLDVMMPETSGWEVLHAFQLDPVLKDIPVIMVSLLNDNGAGLALGAADYVTKPVNRSRLLGAVQPFLADPGDIVLVVEDDDDVRDLVRRSLTREGYSVRTARNGRLALEELETLRPALVLLDLMMPEMDGFAVVAAMRENPELADIPVVILTAMDLTPGQRLSLSGQVSSILGKGSFSKEKLLRQVRGLVSAAVLPSHQ
ncbi:MAG: response regulator [Proteobacteria bacterium]|nr:response regulator [Pseudomonadota bacterium]